VLVHLACSFIVTNVLVQLASSFIVTNVLVQLASSFRRFESFFEMSPNSPKRSKYQKNISHTKQIKQKKSTGKLHTTQHPNAVKMN